MIAQNSVVSKSPIVSASQETVIQQHGSRLQALVEEMIGGVLQTVQEHLPLHELERQTWGRLLAMGHEVLALLFALLGPGDVGETVTLGEGRKLRRLVALHHRPYQSPFGDFDLERYGYGTREGQELELVPLDERLALPAGKFSYLLQEWDQSEIMEAPFGQASRIVKRILGLKQYVESLEQMNRQMSEQVESYHHSQAVPPPESEASLVVQTIDHKGVIIRHPADRSTIADHDPQSEPRQDRKRMAAVAGVYTVEPYVRTPEQVLEALFAPPGQRRSEEPPRPRPQHKRLRACLSHVDSRGDEINGTAAMFGWLAEETQARNPQGLKTLIHITDGERQLRTGCEVFQADVPMVAILDLLHATSRVWAMSRLFCGDEASRTAFVKERVRWILCGEVTSVVQSLRSLATRRKLKGKPRAEVDKVCAYFESNADRMHYDEYLAKGYPIASGVIEGACRHVVKDRMERTGMGWTVAGAQAMLSLRCLWVGDDWDVYLAFRTEQETTRLHPPRADLKEMKWAWAI
jgi:hypothetical protein